MPVAEGWKAKFGGLEASEAKRLRELRGDAVQEKSAPFIQDVVALCNQAPHMFSLKERRQWEG